MDEHRNTELSIRHTAIAGDVRTDDKSLSAFAPGQKASLDNLNPHLEREICR